MGCLALASFTHMLPEHILRFDVRRSGGVMQFPATMTWGATLEEPRVAQLNSVTDFDAALDCFAQFALADVDWAQLATIADRDGHALTVGICAQGAYIEFVSREIQEGRP